MEILLGLLVLFLTTPTLFGIAASGATPDLADLPLMALGAMLTLALALQVRLAPPAARRVVPLDFYRWAFRVAGLAFLAATLYCMGNLPSPVSAATGTGMALWSGTALIAAILVPENRGTEKPGEGG